MHVWVRCQLFFYVDCADFNFQRTVQCPFVPVNLCTALRFPSRQIHSLTHSCELPSYWATDMRQAVVAVRTKQISTELKSHPYPLHKHDGLCAYVCVKFNHLSPANEQSSFPCVWNKPVKEVFTNQALVCAWICARSWTFVYPCKRMCLPRRGSSRLLTRCETVSMRCVQGGRREPAGENHTEWS